MKKIFIFDIDGTIADLTHRLHFISDKPKNWGRFYGGCDLDDPIDSVISVMESLRRAGYEIWHFTGRTESVRCKTMCWLIRHTGYKGEPVVMRENGDYRQDYIVKQEMLDRMLDVDRERIVGVFDDRQQVVDMWRRNGIKCFQVADGDF